MKLSTREDIDAPIEAVWAAITDADAFEGFAERNGGVARRIDDGTPGLGSGWVTRFEYRGVAREMETIVSSFDAPKLLEVDNHVGGIDGYLRVALEQAPNGKTRMQIALDLRPTNLSGRVTLQTLKLVKGRLETRLCALIARFAREFPASA